MLILLTGATGFIGRALCASLLAEGHTVRAVVRALPAPEAGLSADRLELIVHPDLAAASLPRAALQGVDAIVHLAGIAQVARAGAGGPAGAQRYERSNVTATRLLAEAAAAAGVRRFVFASSTRVYGATPPAWLDGATPTAPDEPYGASKLAAEGVLATTPLQVIALRIPAVYGPGGKGGLATLMGWIHRGRPLPLGSLRAPRSLLYVGNLVAAVARVVTSTAPATTEVAPFRQYLLADPDSIGMADLIATLAQGLGVPARNWPVRAALLRIVFKALGRSAAWQRLSSAAQIDSNRFCQAFNFAPPFTVREGLLATARARAYPGDGQVAAQAAGQAATAAQRAR